MKKTFLIIIGFAIGLPLSGRAQDSGLASGIGGLQAVLDQIYTEMVVHASELIGMSQAIAGFAALFYIGVRVWRSIARAEPVDVYPLFRPFVIGFAITIFPSVIALINGVMSPTVTGTAAILNNSNSAIGVLLQEKESALKKGITYQMYEGDDGSGSEKAWLTYNGNSDTGTISLISNALSFQAAKAAYKFKNQFRLWMSEALELVYESAALCINTLRTFNLIVLAILGPLVFGLSVFDGFHHTLTAWLSRYINIFLWLPVANIFGSIISDIQTHMLQLDISHLQANGATYFSATDAGYMVFLIIGIVGYFSVPSIANYIVHAGDSGSLHARMMRMGDRGVQYMQSTADSWRGSGRSGGSGGREGAGWKAPDAWGESSSRSEYQRNKISGKK